MTLPAAFAQQSDNRAPVAVGDIATTGEDTAVTLAVLANDSDPDGNTLSVEEVTSPAHGTAVVNADGTVRYTPAANFHGSDTFAYTIEDGEDGEASAPVTVTVTPVNDAPVLGDDVATTTEGTAVILIVLANDSDADGDALTVTAVSTPTHGTSVINAAGNTVTYVPAGGFEGVDTFTYTVEDGHGGLNVALVTVTVEPADDDDDGDADDGDADDEDARKAECKDGGWHDLGFRNQGLCIAFGGDLDDLDDGSPWPLQEDWDRRHADDDDHQGHGHGLGLGLDLDQDDDEDEDSSELHEERGHQDGLRPQLDDHDDGDDGDDDHDGRGRRNGHGRQ